MTRYFGVHTLEGEWHSLLPRYVLLSDRVEGKRILDIGCGTGIGSSLLMELGAEQVNAIDHRPAVLELARVKHAKDNLDFHVMFWEELDFPDHSFDMVLCLDPTSPVTDPSLLQEIKRVLKSDGEYICAIEHRNIEGLEGLLPRYGYNAGGEDLPLSRTGERVPQLGELKQFFETITSVVQRPRYSYLFDFDADPSFQPHASRKVSADESGLWIGDNPEKKAAEQTDQRPGRWIHSDDRLCERDGDPTSVNLLFCGDLHMPPPTLKEVEMPYLGLVDRLQKIIAELQVRQHPSQKAPSFHEVLDSGDDDPPTREFTVRETTSEFYALPPRNHSHRPLDEPPAAGLSQIQDQLREMTNQYQQMRGEMETLFQRTRQELLVRDQYIEQLVDTVRRWEHHFYRNQDQRLQNDPLPVADAENAFESEPTRIFARPELEPQADDQEAALAGDSEPVTLKHGEDSLSEESSSEATLVQRSESEYLSEASEVEAGAEDLSEESDVS